MNSYVFILILFLSVCSLNKPDLNSYFRGHTVKRHQHPRQMIMTLLSDNWHLKLKAK